MRAQHQGEAAQKQSGRDREIANEHGVPCSPLEIRFLTVFSRLFQIAAVPSIGRKNTLQSR
jgi:hypothetical protein